MSNIKSSWFTSLELSPLRRIISKILGVKVLRLNKCQAKGTLVKVTQ